MMSIKLVPYGNARETKNPDGSFNFTCQHGEIECEGNLIEACIIDMAKNDPEIYFPVIRCMENSDNPVYNADNCTRTHSDLPYLDVHVCAYGKKGKALMHKNAMETAALNPPHKFVPWVTVDGKADHQIEVDAEQNLLAVVCNFYKGKRPGFCGPALLKMAMSKFQDAMEYANAF